jgi:hypothetical protein
MRDKRFVALHRGGPLQKEQHRQLMRWAHDCAKHVLPLLGENTDKRLNDAFVIAIAWERGEASVGDARNASLKAIAVANESSNPTAIAVARAVGHAAATAHMADHALRAAEYALKAIKTLNKLVETERKWQDEQVPSEIIELVLSARNKNAP